MAVQAHPDLGLTTATGANGLPDAILLGYAFDPQQPGRHEHDLLERLVRSATRIEEAAARAAEWTGRFVLLIAFGADGYALHDPCGFRMVFYAADSDGVALASQPHALPGYADRAPSAIGRDWAGGAYRHAHEPWFPSGTTLKEGVGHLLPNHYLDFRSLSQTRFWPTGDIPEREVNAAASSAAEQLCETVGGSGRRYKLALPVTGGWDSRVLLAASSRLELDDLYTFTLLYGDLDGRHPDVWVPLQMTRALGIEHHLLECRLDTPADFLEVYNASCEPNHREWAEIAYGISRTFPQDRVALKGAGSEIARETYPDFFSRLPAARKVAALESGWETMPSFVGAVDRWIGEVAPIVRSSNWRLLDLFYWEHRMGSWQAQSQTEWDVVQEEFSPYNYRPLLVTMLGAPLRSRGGRPHSAFYAAMLNALEPRLARWPVNPRPWRQQVRNVIKNALRTTGVYGEARYAYKRGRALFTTSSRGSRTRTA